VRAGRRSANPTTVSEWTVHLARSNLNTVRGGRGALPGFLVRWPGIVFWVCKRREAVVAEASVRTENDDVIFRDALQGLYRGDFSRLQPLFTTGPNLVPDPPQIIRWYQEGRFRDESKAAAEALTCACFLGRTDVAEYLLARGVDPSAGVGTGLDALHWAANRGQLESVRLLLRRKALLETRSIYGGTVLGTAVWSAINEPRPDHLHIIEELLIAGARVNEVEYPTGNDQVDEVLQRHRAA
jgi:hypothetical protein